MNPFLQIILIVLASFSALMSLLVIVRLRQPVSPLWWVFKVFASAFSPFFAVISALSVILAIITSSLWTGLISSYSTLFFIIYLYRVNRSITDSPGFTQAFGQDWENRMTSSQKSHFLSSPTPLLLPAVSEYDLIQNITICTIPDTNRQLLCDIWQPPKHVKASGMAFIYFHGSAWCVLDKDFGTRPFFKH